MAREREKRENREGEELKFVWPCERRERKDKRIEGGERREMSIKNSFLCLQHATVSSYK